MSIKETFRRKWEGKAPGAADAERAQLDALLYLAEEIDGLKKRLDDMDRAAGRAMRNMPRRL